MSRIRFGCIGGQKKNCLWPFSFFFTGVHKLSFGWLLGGGAGNFPWRQGEGTTYPTPFQNCGLFVFGPRFFWMKQRASKLANPDIRREGNPIQLARTALDSSGNTACHSPSFVVLHLLPPGS